MSQTARLLAGGFLTVVISFGISRYLYTPVLPIMQKDFGYGIEYFGLLAGVNMGGYLVGSLLATFLSASAWRVTLFRVGLVVSAATTLAMGLNSDPGFWIVVRALAGVGNAFAFIAATAIVSDALVRIGDEGRLGWLFCGMGAGIVTAGLLVPAGAIYLSSSSLWIAGGAISIALLPFILNAVKPVMLEARAGRSPPRHVPAPFPFWPLLLTYSIGGIGFASFATFIVAIVKSRPGFEVVGDWVWIFVGLFAIPSGLFSSWLAARIGYAHALFWIYVLQTLAILLPAITGHDLAVLLAAALFGLTFMATPFLVSALGSHGFGGRGFGALTFGGGIGQAVGPLLVRLFEPGPNAYNAVLLTSACTTLVAICILIGGMVVSRLRYARPASAQ